MNEHNKEQHLRSIEKDPIVKDLYEKGFSYSEIKGVMGVSIRAIQDSVKRLGLYRFKRESDDKYKKRIVELRKSGMLMKDIALELGKDVTTIREHIRKMGLNSNDRIKLAKDEQEAIIKLNRNGLTINEIADKMGVSRQKIKKCLVKFNEKENKKCESCGVRIEEKRMCEECKTSNAILYRKSRDNKPKDFKGLLKYRYNSISSGAKGRGLSFNIGDNYLDWLRDKQEGKCAITGEKFVLSGKDKKTKASVDRFDNSKGYIEGNIMFVSYWINERKGDMSLEELKEYMPIVYERGKKFLKSLDI